MWADYRIWWGRPWEDKARPTGLFVKARTKKEADTKAARQLGRGEIAGWVDCRRYIDPPEDTES